MIMNKYKDVYEISALTTIKESRQNKQPGYTSNISLMFEDSNKKYL
jgi:hypothetical protein